MTPTETLIERARERVVRVRAEQAAQARAQHEQRLERDLEQARKLAGRLFPDTVALRLEWRTVADADLDGGTRFVAATEIGEHADRAVWLVYTPRKGDTPERLVPAVACEHCSAFVPAAGALEHKANADGLALLGAALEQLAEQGPADCWSCTEAEDPDLEEPEPGPDDEAAAQAHLETAIDELFGTDALLHLHRVAAGDPLVAAVLYLAGRVDRLLIDTRQIAEILTAARASEVAGWDGQATMTEESTREQ